MDGKDLIRLLPFSEPYLFVDEITEFSEDHLIAAYTFKQEEFFYKGHFPGRPRYPWSYTWRSSSPGGPVFGDFSLQTRRKRRKSDHFSNFFRIKVQRPRFTWGTNFGLHR